MSPVFVCVLRLCTPCTHVVAGGGIAARAGEDVRCAAGSLVAEGLAVEIGCLEIKLAALASARVHVVARDIMPPGVRARRVLCAWIRILEGPTRALVRQHN